MLKRVKQVWAALTAHITEQERDFVDRHLTAAQRPLFWAMSLPDQRHTLNVCLSALRLADRTAVDIVVLLQAALLHDVGRCQGDVSTIDKIIAVVADACCPVWARAWSRQGRGSRLANVRHALYIYYRHPELGGLRLQAVGTDPRVVAIVRNHHEAPADNDPPELRVLRAADELH